jgi:hypothetical protein
MPGKQAKILSDQHIEGLLFYAGNSRQPDRNRAIVLLSMKAGLRAAEIANLTRTWWWGRPDKSARRSTAALSSGRFAICFLEQATILEKLPQRRCDFGA